MVAIQFIYSANELACPTISTHLCTATKGKPLE
nr:MAG TPA: hypothetical protein [Caudoviricetes sp.]